jgi:hypothetical protein
LFFGRRFKVDEVVLLIAQHAPDRPVHWPRHCGGQTPESTSRTQIRESRNGPRASKQRRHQLLCRASSEPVEARTSRGNHSADIALVVARAKN